MKNKPKSLYIHIPFCDHICTYCDFTKLFYMEKYEKPYLEALFKEINSYNIDKVDTIYIGGGTPTSLSDEGFELLLKKVTPFLSESCEFTVEANVENLTTKKLELMKANKVNRLSIGIQSSSNKTLKDMGRNHSFEDATKVVKEAKKIGFTNINVDFIYGFEGQTIENLKNDLDEFIKLDVDHVSIYSLIIEQGSILFNKGMKPQSEEESREFYNFIVDFLRKHDYKRYEVSNFARNNKFSKHNLTYWNNKEYYGCGLGASGFVDDVRYINHKNIDTYISGNFKESEEKVTPEMNLEYFLITNLRKEDGFLKVDFENEFGYSFESKFLDKIKQNKLENLFNISNESISLSDEGLILMDFVILKLL